MHKMQDPDRGPSSDHTSSRAFRIILRVRGVVEAGHAIKSFNFTGPASIVMPPYHHGRAQTSSRRRTD